MKRKSQAWGGNYHYRSLEMDSAAGCVKECLEDQTRCLYAAAVKTEDKMLCYLYDDVNTWPMEKEDSEFFIRSCPENAEGLLNSCHEIIALSVLRKYILQMHMHSHLVGLDVCFLVRPFIYFHFILHCVRTVKARLFLIGSFLYLQITHA